MLRIAITPEVPRQDEVDRIRAIIGEGWDRVHLRWPRAGVGEYRRVLDQLATRELAHVVLHSKDHAVMALEYPVGGRHGVDSCSCHTLEELRDNAGVYNYCFLSPICDSVSKQGYQAAFAHDQLLEIKLEDRAVALGGITPETLPLVRRYNFVGYAVLGYLAQATTIENLIQRLRCFNS